MLRKANQVVDCLAKHNVSLNIDFNFFNVVPSLISSPFKLILLVRAIPRGFNVYAI
jgi:hypothetical protein